MLDNKPLTVITNNPITYENPSNAIFYTHNINQLKDEVHKINDENDDDFIEAVEDTNTNALPQEIKIVEDVPKEINFLELIKNPVNVKSSKNLPEINFKTEDVNKQQVQQQAFNQTRNNKVSLDDLFTDLDLNQTVNELKVEDNKIANEIINANENKITNDIEFVNEVKNEIENKVDDEFVEIEDSLTNTNNIDHKIPQYSQYNIETPIEEIPKHSIINFTPVDFLNEFKKENNLLESKKETNEEFEFVEEKEHVESENLCIIEFLLSTKLKDENLILKCKENVDKINTYLNKEMQIIEEHFILITNFLNNKKFNKDLFMKDRKLINFINSSVQLLLFTIKIDFTFSEINDKLNAFQIINLIKKLEDLLEASKKTLNLRSSIDEVSFNKLHNYKPVLDQDHNNKVCYLCFHRLDEELSTNVFSYDFHIFCINIWLNGINTTNNCNSSSPYLI